MMEIWSLTKRNILVYIKDRLAVFFSLLSALIIIGLYALFLAEVNIKAVESFISIDRQEISFLVNSWVMAGIVIVNTVTITLGVLGIMIDDEAKNRLQAFLVSPVSRFKLTLGYVLSAFIIGNVLCIITYFISQLYIAGMGGSLLGFRQSLKALGLIVASVFSSTGMVFFIISLVRSRNTFSTISTIVGTLIGFAAGIYLPIGELPATAQKFIKCVPIFYSTSIMRSIFMAAPVERVFKGIPDSIISNYMKTMGADVYWNNTIVPDSAKIGIILISGMIFLALSVMVMKRRKMAQG